MTRDKTAPQHSSESLTGAVRSRAAMLTKIPTGPEQAPRFRRLARAIEHATGAPSPLSHLECEAALEFYIDDERQGRDVHQLYPAVFAHIQRCVSCMQSYSLLSLADAQDPLPAKAPQAPAARILPPSPSPALTWDRHWRSTLDGGSLRFGFTIHADHVRHVMAFRPGPMVVRSPQSRVSRALLLSDTLVLGHRQVAVEAWAFPMQPAFARISVRVTSSSPLPVPLRVALKWHGHELSDWMHEGESSFDAIPIADLTDAQDLRIEFDTSVPPGEPARNPTGLGPITD